jgi:hypothetical protein
MCIWLYDMVMIQLYMCRYMILNIYDIHYGLYNHVMIVCIVAYVYMIYIVLVMEIVYDTISERSEQVW